MNTQLVTFNNHNLNIIHQSNQLWLSSGDIASALGYEKTKSITNLFNNHKDEFADNSLVIDSVTSGKKVKTRIFNREGAWLIGMFARTPKAVEFRKWVLRVLGAVADSRVKPENDGKPVANQNSLTQDRAALKAIGGIVKKCAAVAVREELASLLSGNKEADWECSDQDLIFWLHRWHNTKNKADTLEFRRLHSENEELKHKLLAIKKAVN